MKSRLAEMWVFSYMHETSQISRSVISSVKAMEVRLCEFRYDKFTASQFSIPLKRSRFYSTDRFVVVCGDGEYIIYTAMALRNKSFGSAQEFVWAADSSEYGIRENSKVKLFKNFKEKKSFKPDYGAESKQCYVKSTLCKVCKTWCNRSF